MAFMIGASVVAAPAPTTAFTPRLVSGDEVAAAVSARRVLNVNLGIVGHVDSGKTSLARSLSTHLSTASLDRAPQSQQRGITLDLGFSAFYLTPPPHLARQYDLVQYTLVDCPGHSSLLRSIIGGSSIIDCFPEADTRVLTSRGLLFLDEIEAVQAGGEELLFGCYDKASEQLQYSKGRLVLPERPPTHLVDFTQQGEAQRWTEQSGPHGTHRLADGEEEADDSEHSGHISLRVTPGHTMFVQTGIEGSDASVAWERASNDGGSEQASSSMVAPPCEASAESMLPQCHHRSIRAGCKQCRAHVRLLTHTKAGYVPQRRSCCQAVQRALGLLDSQFTAFVELLGFWLAQSALQYRGDAEGCNAVAFAQVEQHDLVWLTATLYKVGLLPSQWTTCTCVGVAQLLITDKVWFEWFAEEFGATTSHTSFDHSPPNPASSTRSLLSRPQSASSTSLITPGTARRSSWSSVAIDMLVTGEDEEGRNDEHRSPRRADGKSSEPVARTAVHPKRNRVVQLLPDWLLFELSRDEMRLLIDGLRRAQSADNGGRNLLYTSSALFRDQLMQALLHCGYSPFAKLQHPAGTIQGYQCRDSSVDRTICSVSDCHDFSPATQLLYQPIRSTTDSWRVSWSDWEVSTAGAGGFGLSMPRQCITRVPYDAERDGRVWCVTVEHADHLIIAQRAQRDEATGLVNKQSRPVITGNCMLLVVDAQRGIQTQTAECLVLGEMLVQRMVVCVNKCDLLSSSEQKTKLERGLRQTFKATKFGAHLPIVYTSCAGPSPSITSLLAALCSSELAAPTRAIDAPLYLPVDHSFSIKGQGYVLTGTVLTGRVTVGDSVYVPALRQSRKVKSLQCFHTPVDSAVAGERVAVCVSGLEGEKVERGLLCAPDAVKEVSRVVVWVEKVRFYKEEVRNGQSLHISVGHDTLMAACTFFAPSAPLPGSATSPASFDPSQPFLHLPTLPATPCYALLVFSQPLFLPSHLSLPLIASHLNANYTGKSCRLAFSARHQHTLPASGAPLRLYKEKRKEGVVDRVQPNGECIGRAMFEAAEEVGRYTGMNVTVDAAGGASGRIEGGFGKGGKFRVYVTSSASGGSGGAAESGWVGKKLVLSYRQFLPDEHGKKRISQGVT